MTEAAVILANHIDIHTDALQPLTCIIYGPFTISGWQQHIKVQQITFGGMNICVIDILWVSNS